jgi:metallo-beta-lactamase family protein
MVMPRLTFLGAADTVTGSRYLVESGSRRVLVDCGLFQGYKTLRERNRARFAVPPESIDAVLLTHAHLDHSGYVPALVRDGYRGRVFATPGTTELCRILLPDSGRLLEEEAESARRGGYSRHRAPRPLYTEVDALTALRSFHLQPFASVFQPVEDVEAEFIPAGHITGAAQITLRLGESRLHFSGDLGRAHDPLMRAPAPLPDVDVLVVESTYGDRRHPDGDPASELGAVVRRVASRGGVVVIPAFAVGRAESILLHLSRLRDRGDIPTIPVYLDSPMAVAATAVSRTHPEEHRVTADEAARVADVAIPVSSTEESMRLSGLRGPMIIVSASGMITGGRVLHHVARLGPDRRNAIVLTGYQAGGTRGADLAQGARMLRIFGRDVPIEAEVVQLDSFSAHADAEEVLAWLRSAARPPGMTYVTHGEPEAADTLRRRIQHELGWNVRVPGQGEVVDLARDSLDEGGARSTPR